MPPTDSIYNWTFTGSTVTGTMNTTNATAFFNAAGNQVATLNVKYRKSASNGAFLTTVSDVASATLNVSSQSSPTITINGAGAICSGSGATLTASGNTTFTWTNPASNSSSIVVTPIVNTIYTVNAVNLGCTGTQTALVTVSNPPNVTATGPGNICVNSGFTLTATGATSYSWSNASTNTSITVTPNAPGVLVYTVTGFNAPCPASSVVLTVTVNALPTITLTAPATTVCSIAGNGNTITLTGLPSGGNFSGVNISPTGVFNPITQGTYPLVYTYLDFQTGCSKSSTVNLVVSNCTDINNRSVEEKPTVYPNPTTDGLIYLANIAQGASIKVYTVLGDLIIQEKCQDKSCRINLSAYPAGPYLIIINSAGDSPRTIKIVNQNH
ncbi:MAG: T9SS type A sorting domain-containing protein [Flavobacteriia bacterium]|nr:T9SS type A sorting domain-containing protein [Flavobacteriia bacterium]